MEPPQLVIKDEQTFKTIVNCIPEGTRFSIGHIDGEGTITGHGGYIAGLKSLLVLHETGTCQLEDTK